MLDKHFLLVTSFKNIDKQNVLVKKCLSWWPNGQACLPSKVRNFWQTVFVRLARALFTRYILPPYQKLKQVNHPSLSQVNLPFYPIALLLRCDHIKYWSIQGDHYERKRRLRILRLASLPLNLGMSMNALVRKYFFSSSELVDMYQN